MGILAQLVRATSMLLLGVFAVGFLDGGNMALAQQGTSPAQLQKKLDNCVAGLDESGIWFATKSNQVGGRQVSKTEIRIEVSMISAGNLTGVSCPKSTGNLVVKHNANGLVVTNTYTKQL